MIPRARAMSRPLRRLLAYRRDAADVLSGLAIILAFTVPIAFLTVACEKSKHTATLAKDGVVQCAKADAGPLLQLTGELAAAAVASVLKAGAVDWDELVAKAKAAGLQVGGCAFVALYHALDKEPEVTARSMTAAPDPRRAALEQLRAAAGGARWVLADGSVL
jgi:hypothetical protein